MNYRKAKLGLIFFLISCSTTQVHFEKPISVQESIAETKGNPARLSEFKLVKRRMNEYAKAFGSIFQNKRIPLEFLAIPIVQSGYQNLAEHGPEDVAGIWSFSPYTANTYGLNTEAGRDDRTDPSKSTEAAADYLNHLQSLFHDWRWTVLAYSFGEGTIETALRENPRISPWDFEASHPEHEPRLTQTWAAIELVRDLNDE